MKRVQLLHQKDVDVRDVAEAVAIFLKVVRVIEWAGASSVLLELASRGLQPWVRVDIEQIQKKVYIIGL